MVANAVKGILLADMLHFLCVIDLLPTAYRFVGLVVRRQPRERKIPGFNPFGTGIFSGSSHTSDSKNDTPVATLPGVIGSALGLVGPVSVYYDWVR